VSHDFNYYSNDSVLDNALFFQMPVVLKQILEALVLKCLKRGAEVTASVGQRDAQARTGSSIQELRDVVGAVRE
jgi:hypothetical protein